MKNIFEQPTMALRSPKIHLKQKCQNNLNPLKFSKICNTQKYMYLIINSFTVNETEFSLKK